MDSITIQSRTVAWPVLKIAWYARMRLPVSNAVRVITMTPSLELVFPIKKLNVLSNLYMITKPVDASVKIPMSGTIS